MLKLRKLQVGGFRGVLNEAVIDFDKPCRSLVIVGNNGTGKSSFVDAVEWVLTDRIEHLAREGCGDLAYRHRRLSPQKVARIEIVTSDPTIAGARVLDGQRHSQFEPEGCPLSHFVQQARGDTVILRYGQMRDFVDKTKGEKLRYLADILGLRALSDLRDELVKTVNQLQKDEGYRYLASQIKDYEQRLRQATGSKRFESNAVLALAEQLRIELGGSTPISNAETLRDSTDEILARSQRNARAREIMVLRQAIATLDPAVADNAMLSQIDTLAGYVRDLQNKKSFVDALALAQLYGAGQTVLERRVGNLDTCPLCDQPVDRQHLLVHLETQLTAIAEIGQDVARLDSERRSVADLVNRWQAGHTAVATLVGSIETPDSADLGTAAEQAVALIRRVERSLRQDAGSLSPVYEPSADERDLLRRLAHKRGAARNALAERLQTMEGSDEQKAYYDKLERLDHLTRDFVAWCHATQHKRQYDRQIQTIQIINEQFELVERRALEAVLETVSSDVNRYYLKLHPDEGFDQIRLWPTEARGLEFEFGYHGERISPPGALLSESHLNTLGICLFLASARQFNRHTRFLILDDIINSVDTGHRQPLARLLRDEFEDFQLILLTHDRMWFDILRRVAPSWITKEIGGWSYEDGLWFKDDPGDLVAETRGHLARGDVTSAGNTARRWYEKVLKDRCSDLEVLVAFRYNDRNEERMPGELLPALKTYLGNAQIHTVNKALFLNLEASQFVGSRLSHDNQFPSGVPQAADIELFLQDIRQLDHLFLCPECGTYIATKHTPSSAKRKRCKCGHLELR